MKPPIVGCHLCEAGSAIPKPAAAVPLAPVPPEAAWFAGIRGARNRRGYLRDVREFMAFCGFENPDRLREAAPEQVAAWRARLGRRRCGAS